jgi:Zn finger protein HypA/HybF involved in hydrogenase expression
LTPVFGRPSFIAHPKLQLEKGLWQANRDFFISYLEESAMKYRKQVHYVKGVFACPKCHQHFVQEKWLEEFRVRCHKCDYRGALTHVSVEEQMDEEIERR